MSLTASMKATVVHTDGAYKVTAAAAQAPGDVIIRPDGTLAIFEGFQNVASGDEIQPTPIHPTLICEFRCTSGDTWAAGALLYWDDTLKVATATVGTNKRIGLSTSAKTSGQTTKLINCVPADAVDPA